MKPIAKNQFIGTYTIKESICDALIDLFKKTPVETDLELLNKPAEDTIFMKTHNHNHPVKKATNLYFRNDILTNSKIIGTPSEHIIEPITNYSMALNRCLHKYSEELCFDTPDLGGKLWASYFRPLIWEAMIIQYYQPGGGFTEWHSERAFESNYRREYVFMTYLNDVPDGGTEFYYQDLKVNAEKGKTLIWPAHYTHMHRSQVSHTQEKYIVTGWVSFPDTEKGQVKD